MWASLKKTRRAVVTGSAGIALGIGQRLLRDGFGVILCGIDKEHNAAARALLDGEPADVIDVDVSD
jgi:NAD(P)-dependent dehydrogenase (short-subunit alcohol dehydrogenase family)